MSKDQIHSKFKAFTASIHGKPFEALKDQLQGFLSKEKVTAKSVGILSAHGKLVLTLGYRDDEPSYPVQLSEVSLGKPEISPAALEKAMTQATAGKGDIICHELIVHDDEVLAVILSRQ